MDLRKAKTYLDKNYFLDTINVYSPRGNRPDTIVKPYAKW